MIWYEVNVNHVMGIVIDCCRAINACLDNIKLPRNEEECRDLEEGYNSKQLKRFRALITPGTILAGDGLVCKIHKPKSKDEADSQKFRNRKCCYGLICQAFCDSDCMFRFFECSWPGNTNDVTAYKQTQMYHDFKNLFPRWCNIVLDEAYLSCGDQHCTPFSKFALEKAKRDNNIQLHDLMRIYNLLLSSQRVTIERAFGQLVRRFGILWKPIEYALNDVPLLIAVCAKLHNVCVSRWLMISSEEEEMLEHCNAPAMPSFEDIRRNMMFNNYDDEDETYINNFADRRMNFFSSILSSGLAIDRNGLLD